jgi:hypothetical protein
MLMHTVSLRLQLPSRVTIHNQCLNTRLLPPVYFGNGTVRTKLSDQRIGIGTAMNVSFDIYATQDEFEGALLYKLQRHSDSQYDMYASTMGTNGAKCVQMFVAWKVKDSKPFLYVVLIEHTKEFTWDEEKLSKLYNKNHSRLKEYKATTIDTWLIDDNMTLKMSFKVRGLKGNFELSISISEEESDDYAMRPLCVDPER